jgi:small-conductance mechanosensitive channel
MFRATTFLGISMARRSNRRILVLCTYSAVMAFAAWLSLSKPPLLWMFVTQFVWFTVAYLIFGRIVTAFGMVPFFDSHVPHVIERGMALGATVPEDEPVPDERELALRNSSYYFAYRLFTGACIVAVLVVEAAFGFQYRFASSVVFSTLLLLIVLAISLPQAVLLWRERDLPRDL